MYISKTIREAVVNVKEGKEKGIAVRIEVDQAAEDNVIYEVQKAIQPLLEGSVFESNIILRKLNVLDQAPIDPPPIDPPPIEPPKTQDTIITLTNMQGEVYGLGLSNEQVYGANMDGQNRKVNLYWKDGSNVEHKVPLLGFDNEEPLNPNKKWSYYSEGDYINFEIAVSGAVEYILRKEV